MSHEKATTIIKRTWEIAWSGGTLAALPIEHNNLPFTQPKQATWGRLTLITGRTTPQALGGRSAKLNRTPFVLTLQIFIPENRGTKDAQRAADAMAALDYVDVSEDGVTVRFETAGMEPAPTDGQPFEAFNVTIGGTYDTRPSP